MTFQSFKKLEEGMQILINGRLHEITMKSSYMRRPDNNWRFMPIDIPKKDRRGYNELYISMDDGLKKFLRENLVQVFGKEEQLSLF